MTAKQLEILSKLFKEGKISLEEVLVLCKRAENPYFYSTSTMWNISPEMYKVC